MRGIGRSEACRSEACDEGIWCGGRGGGVKSRKNTACIINCGRKRINNEE